MPSKDLHLHPSKVDVISEVQYIERATSKQSRSSAQTYGPEAGGPARWNGVFFCNMSKGYILNSNC